MIRNIKYIIREARNNTNTLDNESISNDLCAALLNRSLDYLISYLYNRAVNIRVFAKEINLGFTAGSKTYDLPWDVYTDNGIINVRYESNGYSTFLNQISDKNRTDRAGYVVTGKTIFINPMPVSYGNYFLKYSARVPRFGNQAGVIVSVGASTVTVVAYDPLLSDKTEYVTIVDSDGLIVSSRLKFTQAGDILTLNTDNLLPGMIVVPGYYATTHCPLPDELESVLINMLEVLINARLSSTDLPIADAISSAQLETLAETFSSNTPDPIVPPIQEFREWV